MSKYDPTRWHYPHWLRQPNNQIIHAGTKDNTDQLKCGHQYVTRLVDITTGETVAETKHGTFLRFEYDLYTDEASKQFKEWAREYESKVGQK